ncbi:MAG: glycosyltransferase [Candidatus Methylomirabilales bacterium]
MKKPRLAWLVSGLGAVERGAEGIALNLARHLRRQFDITLFGQGCVNGEVSRLWALSRDRWVAVKAFEALSPSLRTLVRRLHLTPVEIEMLTFSLSAFGSLWKGRFDGHLLATGVWGSRLARIFRILRGVPFIYVGHGGYSGELPHAKERPDLHIFVNRTVMQEVEKAVPSLRAVFIPNGVDLERFAPRPSNISWELERPIYLAVGALVREKSLDLAIRAVAALPKGSLVLVGRGAEEGKLRMLGETLLGTKRFLLTAVPFAAMPDLYNACDVFTLPTLKEPFGLVYLEAMACGKPVVGHRDQSRELIVGQAGILCCCHEINDYAAALARAAQGEIGEDPRKQAERFDIREIAQQYADVIQEVLENRSR